MYTVYCFCNNISVREKHFITLTPGDHAFWIGLTDIFQEGKFVWTTGAKVTYTNWNGTEPNNTRGKEHFGQIYPKSIERKWNDNLNDRDNIYALCQFTL